MRRFVFWRSGALLIMNGGPDNPVSERNSMFLLSSEGLRFLRFIAVGVINTAAGYGFYAAYLFIGIPYLIAGTLSFVTGICFNYLVTRRFVFDKVTQRHTFIYYLVAYGFLYFYSLAMLWLLIEVVKLSSYLAGIVALPINAVVSFVLLRTIVFRQRRIVKCS